MSQKEQLEQEQHLGIPSLRPGGVPVLTRLLVVGVQVPYLTSTFYMRSG